MIQQLRNTSMSALSISDFKTGEDNRIFTKTCKRNEFYMIIKKARISSGKKTNPGSGGKKQGEQIFKI